MKETIVWEDHPNFENIKKYANYIDRNLDKYDHTKLSSYLKTIQNICEYYHYLEAQNFILALPFYDKRPKGLRSGISVVLPSYAFKDYLWGNLHTNLSNLFNNGNEPLKSLKPTPKTLVEISVLIETIRKSFKDNPSFKDAGIIRRQAEETIAHLVEQNFSYESIGSALA